MTKHFIFVQVAALCRKSLKSFPESPERSILSTELMVEFGVLISHNNAGYAKENAW